MTDIVAFLTARFDERWFAAEAAERTGLWQDVAWPERCGIKSVAEEHILAWSPKAVLADIAAKRAILAHHVPEADLRIRDGKYVQDPPKCTICWLPYPDRGKRQPHPCATLRLLAAPYAEHPDFDSAWRIDG